MPSTRQKQTPLDGFLNSHICGGGKKYTHTRIPGKDCGFPEVCGGSYSIPAEEMDRFWLDYYDKVFVKKQPEYLTERQSTSTKAPILVDVDMQFDASIDERQHTREDVMSLIELYKDVIESRLVFQDGDHMDVYVMQRASVNQLKNKTKDGIHIIFALAVDRQVQILLRKDVVAELPDRWGHIKLTNTWDQVIDEGICRGHVNWMVYGSRKPGHTPYELTEHYRFLFADGIFGNVIERDSKTTFNVKANIQVLSAQYKNHPVHEASSETKAMLDDKSHSSCKSSRRVITSKPPELIRSREELNDAIDEWLNVLQADKPLDYRVKETHGYALALPQKYYGPGSYNNWIRVGWALANTESSGKMFLSWVALSSKDGCRMTLRGSDGKFDWNNIPELWRMWNGFDRDNPEGLTYRSVMYWCMTDAPKDYAKIKKDTIDHFVDETVCPAVHRASATAFNAIAELDEDSNDANNNNKKKKSKVATTEFDVAVVLFQLFKDKYVCASIKNNLWYEFHNNRWYSVENGAPLRFAISKELYTEYFVRLKSKVDSTGYLQTDDDGRLTRRARIINYELHRLSEIALQLRTTKWKDNIMREARELFYDKDFLNKLDQNPYLLCFTNGVVDFQAKCFRQGLPQDYLSKCTNIEFIDHSVAENRTLVSEVTTFMEQLFPNEELRKYMWEHLASTLVGTQENQTFNIYVGTGRNGKSVLVDLMAKVLGEYKGSVPISLITQSRPGIGGTSSEIAQLMGVRYAVMQEPSKGDKINEGIMKEITGGDPIQGRALYKDTVTFTPQFKLVVCTNTLFDIKSNDDGTWRRIRVCDFESKFLEKPFQDELHFPREHYPHQFPLDKRIDRNFDKWAPVFASMLVSKAYETEGNVKDCSAVLQSCNKYRDSQDYISEFIKETLASCKPSECERRILKTEIREAFKDWWSNSDKEGKPTGYQKELYVVLEQRFGKYHAKGWNTIRLINEFDSECDDDDDDSSPTAVMLRM